MIKHIFVITILLIIGIFFINNANQKPQNMPRIAETTFAVSTEKTYIIKDYKGRIALFSDGNEKPLEIYNVFTDSLPEKDAELLKDGIKIKSSELNNALSDYIS